MSALIKKLWKMFVNKETIMYLICGVLTTVVSFGSLKLCTMALGESRYLISNSVSWICAVAFSYVTNKLLVFDSKSWALGVLKKEIPSFVLSRVATYFIEQGTLWLFMDLLKWEGKVFDFKIIAFSGIICAKGIASVFVIIINYIFSKFLIFKGKKKDETHE